MNVSFVNYQDIQPKVAAAVQAGGLDIVELWGGWNYLYKDSLVDLTQEAEAIGKALGGYEDYAIQSGTIDGRFYSIPHGTGPTGMNYRISWFKEAGLQIPDSATQAKEEKWPDLTYEEYHAIGKILKPKGRPLGQSLGQSVGDPTSWCYTYMWAYGAMELDKDRKSVKLNTPEFADGLKKWVQAWKDAYDETGFAWDDSANNRAFLAGQNSGTMNGPTIYFEALKSKPDLANDMDHMPMPRGPAGRFYMLNTKTMGILTSSKNVQAAKEFLKWWFDEKQWGEWFRIQEVNVIPPTKMWAKDPVWDKDPKLSSFKLMSRHGRDAGYAGPPNDKSTLVKSKYIIVDTFVKAVQSGDVNGAIKWGEDQLKRTYGL